MIKFEERLKRSIVALYQWSLKPDSEAGFGEEFVLSLVGTGAGIGRQIVRALIENRMILQVSYEPISYEITPTLISAAEEILEAEPAESKSAPASDRIVTLDHNKPEYKEAVSILDRVVAEFRADHRLDNELGAEKGALLKSLEGGRELLNDAQVRVDAVLSLIIGPLKILATRYEKEIAGGAIGALVTAAITAVMKLFGLG